MPKDINMTESEKEKLMLEHTIEMQSKYLMGLGHELRTPLNVILGFAQLLKQVNSNNLTHTQIANIEEIIQSAEQIEEISKETLAWSKVGMDTHKSALSNVQLSEALNGVYHLLYTESQLKNIRLAIKVDDRFVKVKNILNISTQVIADKFILQQALLNILTMLVKHIPNQSVISIDVATNNAKQNNVQITIHSSKTVYNSQERKQFSSINNLTYEKENSVDTRLIELNLANAKQLLASINGKLKIQRYKNSADLFIIELECADITSNFEGDLTHATKPLVNVLYIEDNPATVRLVKQLLINIGEFSFHSANSASLGLEKAIKLTPALILIDINLPDFNGIELIESLNKMANLDNTHFIAISGEVAESDINKALRQGFDDYITKPICIDEFSKKVKQFSKTLHL